MLLVDCTEEKKKFCDMFETKSNEGRLSNIKLLNTEKFSRIFGEM